MPSEAPWAPGCLLVPPSSSMAPGWCRRASNRDSDNLDFFVFKIEGQNICKMVLELMSNLRKYCRICKTRRKKTSPETIRIKILKISRNRCLESLILTSSPTRNRSFHFSRFRQILGKMVAEGLRNEGLKVPFSPKTC